MATVTAAGEHAARFEMIPLDNAERWQAVLQGRIALRTEIIHRIKRRLLCMTVLNLIQLAAIAALTVLAVSFQFHAAYAVSAAAVWVMFHCCKSNVDHLGDIADSEKVALQRCLEGFTRYQQAYKTRLIVQRKFEASLGIKESDPAKQSNPKLTHEAACSYVELIAIDQYEQDEKQRDNVANTDPAKLAKLIDQYRIKHAFDRGIGVNT